MISKVRGTQDIIPSRFTDKVDAQIERWLRVERADSAASAPAVFIAYIGLAARSHSFALARRLRQAGIRVVVDLEARKLKKALAVANSLAALLPDSGRRRAGLTSFAI